MFLSESLRITLNNKKITESKRCQVSEDNIEDDTCRKVVQLKCRIRFWGSLKYLSSRVEKSILPKLGGR